MYLNSDLTSLVGVRISIIFGYVIAPILILLCVPRVSIFLPRTFLHKKGSAHVPATGCPTMPPTKSGASHRTFRGGLNLLGNWSCMVYLHNSSVHTNSYNFVIGHRKISGAVGSAPQDTTSARRGAKVVDPGGCCDSTGAQISRVEKQGGRAAPHVKRI